MIPMSLISVSNQIDAYTRKPTLSDFPAYESNKTPSAQCSAVRPVCKYRTKMSAWIVGFYQKKVLKLTEFELLSLPVARKLSAAQRSRPRRNEIPISCQSSDSRCCAVMPGLRAESDYGRDGFNPHQSGLCCEALEEAKKVGCCDYALPTLQERAGSRSGLWSFHGHGDPWPVDSQHSGFHRTSRTRVSVHGR
jgi:hypothetical protein